MLFGLDIASYQHYPDFAQLAREGHDFMLTKVTGEGSYVNPYWSLNRDNARAAGLIVGTYDWVEPQGDQTGPEAAEDYLAIVGPRQPGDLLCVDFETPQWASGPLGAAIEPWMRAYLYTLRDRAGQPVIIYTAPYFLNETGASGWAWMCEANRFHLWQAAPGPGMMADDSFWPATPLPFHETTIHQHQWHATSPAIAGEFDRNRFRGTRAELAAYGTPGGKVIGKKEDTGFTHAEGWLEPIRDVFDWGGAGIVVGRSVRVYNDQERAYYRRTWSADAGYGDWVKE
jgi:lysozyme